MYALSRLQARSSADVNRPFDRFPAAGLYQHFTTALHCLHSSTLNMPRGVRSNVESSDAARSTPSTDRHTRSQQPSTTTTLTPTYIPLSTAALASTSDVPVSDNKGKAKGEPARRVLPARLRRSAGGGAEGIRDLEEMVVDWLERYGGCVCHHMLTDR